LLADSARQPLFSVILSIYLCTYVCLQIFVAANGCSSWASCLRSMVYSQTAGVHNIFPSALCGCH